MARWTLRSYWKVVNGVRDQFDLSLAEAREAYRQLRDRFGRSVFGTDLDRHPRLVREEVRDARLAITRRVERQAEEEIARREIVRQAMREAEEPIEYDEFEFTATTKGHTPRQVE